MPYVYRSVNHEIQALFMEAQAEAQEWLPAGHPEVLAFIDGGDENSDFATLDVSFIRVIEDVVDVLIQKGLIRLTDLPAPAQEKLMARKSFRDRRNENSLDLIGNDEII